MLLQSSKAYGVDSDERQAYVTLIKDVLKIFDVNPQVIEDDVNSLLEFETQLSNVNFYYTNFCSFADVVTKLN